MNQPGGNINSFYDIKICRRFKEKEEKLSDSWFAFNHRKNFLTENKEHADK